MNKEKRIKTLPNNITVDELMNVDFGYSYSNKELFDDWNKLKTIRNFKSGSQWKPGLKLCQQFFSNFFDIKATNGNSFNSVKSNPNEMKKILDWGNEKMSALYISWIRKAIYMRWGGHNPTYYRPHLAKQIISFTNKTNGILLDPCAGWGGRMLGTVSSGWNYISCEPNDETYSNLMELSKFLGIDNNIEIHNIPFENFNLDTIDKIDIVLTSPPYFNLETYTSDATQSYIKYNSYNNWIDNWLLPIIELTTNKLSEDGLSCWNVMNFKNTNIVESVIDKHKSLGYELINTIGIDSPFVNYKKKLSKRDLTYIFKKQ